MSLPDFVTVRVKVRTEAPGSACYRDVNVVREYWESLDENERRRLVERTAMRMVKIHFDVIE